MDTERAQTMKRLHKEELRQTHILRNMSLSSIKLFQRRIELNHKNLEQAQQSLKEREEKIKRLEELTS